VNGFTVDLHNSPGEMARVTKALVDHGVNVLIFGIGTNSYGTVGFVANNEDRARSAFDEDSIGYQEIPIVTVQMRDVPGQAALVCQKLADAGINIELWLPVDTRADHFIVAVGVDSLDGAQQTLQDQIVEWNYS
jgi:hypothetical protein